MSAETVVFCKHNFPLIQTMVAVVYKQSVKQIITLRGITMMKVRKEQVKTLVTSSHLTLCLFPFPSFSVCCHLELSAISHSDIYSHLAGRSSPTHLG